MAKLLQFSDLHCHGYTAFAHTLPNGRNSRLQDCLNVVAQAKEVAIQQSCAAVLVLGDVFHSRTKIDIDVYTAAFSAFRDLARVVPLVVLVGNHDQYSKVGDTHSLEPFKEFATVVDRGMTLEQFGCRISAFPCHTDVQSLLSQINVLPPGDLLLLHQAMREGAVGCYGATGHGELSVKDLPLDRFRYVFAGDYHKKQWVVPNKVAYLGSPLQLNFGEAGEFKALTLVDTSTWEVTDIPTNAPRFFVFNSPSAYLDAKEDGSIRPDIDFIRVLFDEQVRDSAEVVKADNERIQIVEESPQKTALQRIGNEVASSDMLLLEAYVEQKAGPLDKERLIAAGLEELWGDAE